VAAYPVSAVDPRGERTTAPALNHSRPRARRTSSKRHWWRNARVASLPQARPRSAADPHGGGVGSRTDCACFPLRAPRARVCCPATLVRPAPATSGDDLGAARARCSRSSEGFDGSPSTIAPRGVAARQRVARRSLAQPASGRPRGRKRHVMGVAETSPTSAALSDPDARGADAAIPVVEARHARQTLRIAVVG
jgi:hypothetical protein